MKLGMWVDQICPNKRVGGIFLVREKKLLQGKTGKHYLLLRLSDRTGEVEARIWDRVEELSGRFGPGDLVRVSGEATTYQGVLQVRVQEVVKESALEVNDLEEFLPDYAVQRQRSEERMRQLEGLVAAIGDESLRGLLLDFLEDPELREAWLLAPAAKRLHHARLGGLLEHTLSVCRLVCLACEHYRELNKDLLLTGAVLHDVGKLRELEAPWKPDYTTEGRLLGHVVMGLRMLDLRLGHHPRVSAQHAMMLRHMVASHHGHLEFGSPKRPKTLEALVLYMLDDLDAKFDSFKEHLQKEGEGQEWTPYHSLLDRYLYRGSMAVPEEEAAPRGEGPEA